MGALSQMLAERRQLEEWLGFDHEAQYRAQNRTGQQDWLSNIINHIEVYGFKGPLNKHQTLVLQLANKTTHPQVLEEFIGDYRNARIRDTLVDIRARRFPHEDDDDELNK